MEIRNAEPGQYLTFTLNKQDYGVLISNVREINQMSEITPVPKTPDYMMGVMNLRGKVIPVVDLRKRMGVPAQPHTRETCIIVIEAEQGQTGMIVDSVKEVLDLEASQLEAPPNVGNDPQANYVIGLGKVNDRVVILLHIKRVLDDPAILPITTQTDAVAEAV